MSRMIFVNLPVKNLPAAMDFYKGLGFSFNPRFTDHEAACMVISETIFAMLLTRPRFADFTPRPILDAHTATEVLIALSCESREEVDAMTAKALAQGAREPRKAQDYGVMYSRSFADLDGHIWEPVWMSPEMANGEEPPPP